MAMIPYNPVVPGAGEGSMADSPEPGVKGEAQARLTESKRSWAKWRREAAKYWRTYKGNPLDQQSLDYMEATDRPAVKYNLAIGTINAVYGADMSELKECRFRGIDQNIFDQTVSDWYTKLVRHYHLRCQGHDHEHAMFLDKLVTGIGVMRVYLDNRRWPFRIRIGHVDNSKVYVDPGAKDANFADARYMFFIDEWSTADAQAAWPKKKAEIGMHARQGSSRAGSSGIVTAHARNYKSGSSAGSRGDAEGQKKNVVEIVEYQYVRSEPWISFTDPETGRDEQLSEKDFWGASGSEKSPKPGSRLFDLQQQADDAVQPGLTHEIDPITGELLLDPETQQPVPILDDDGEPIRILLYPEIDYVGFPKDVYRRAFFMGGEGGNWMLLEDKPLPVDQFTYVFDTGFVERHPDTGKTTWFGLMHLCYDPQLYAVKVLSTLLEMLKRGSKGGVYIKPKALHNPATFLTDRAKPGAAIMLSDDANIRDDIHEQPPMQWPQGLERFFDIAVSGIPEITLVTQAFKGTVTGDRANSLVSNLQTQNMAGLTPLYGPLSRARKTMYLLLARFIMEYMTDQAINRVIGDVRIAGITHETDPATGELAKGEDGAFIPIIGESGQPVTPAEILRGVDILEYDAEVDIGQASPSAKEAVWRIFMDTNLLPQLAEIGVPIQMMIPDLIGYLPIPPEAAARMKGKLEAAMGANAQSVLSMLQQMPQDEQSQVYEVLAGIFAPGAGGGSPFEMPEGVQ